MEKEEIISTQRQSWNKVSGAWEKWSTPLQEWVRPVTEKMIELAALKEGDRVLDAATGTGEPGFTAAKTIGSGEVVGTDLAEDMVVAANELARRAGIANYSAVVAATSDLPFEDNSFNAALSRFGIMFSPDPAADIKELARVVKEGGTVAVGVWGDPSKNMWATLVPSMIQEIGNVPPPPPGAPGIFRCAEQGMVQALMKEAGLTDVQEIEVTGAFAYDSSEQCWAIMTDIAAPIADALSKMEEAEREEVRNRIFGVVRERFMDDGDGKVTIPWSAWVIKGVK